MCSAVCYSQQDMKQKKQAGKSLDTVSTRCRLCLASKTKPRERLQASTRSCRTRRCAGKHEAKLKGPEATLSYHARLECCTSQSHVAVSEAHISGVIAQQHAHDVVNGLFLALRRSRLC